MQTNFKNIYIYYLFLKTKNNFIKKLIFNSFFIYFNRKN